MEGGGGGKGGGGVGGGGALMETSEIMAGIQSGLQGNEKVN